MSSWIWGAVILALAIYAAVVVGNFIDVHVLDMAARKWPPSRKKFWWRRVRFRCQNCGGPLKKSPERTVPFEGREYRICLWCVSLARKFASGQ